MRLTGFATTVRARRALLATAAVAAVTSPAAHAETVAGADASVGVLAASNPFLVAGPDTESGAISLTLRPFVSVTEAATTVTFDGTLNLEQYFDHYGMDESGQVNASIEHRANERTTYSADVGFMSSESAARHFYGGADLSGLDPGEFPNTPVIDPTLANVSGRTSQLYVNFGLEKLVSTNGTLNLSAGLGATKVESGNGQDYRNFRSGISYARKLDERSSLVGTLNVGYADYFNRDAGDGLFVTTLAGVDHQFTESMYGSLQLGFSYAAVDTLLTGREHETNWAATVDLCDMLARGTLCVTGSRSAQPTSLGGVTMVSALGVSYARAIGTAGNVSLGASYSKTGLSDSSPILLGQRESEIAFISGTYSREIADRLSAFITPSFTSNDDEFAGQEENYEVQLGITYHFGKAP